MASPLTTRMEGGRRLQGTARSKPPLVSIITVVFRAAHELLPLFESIVANMGEDSEWIVIDGGSEDGTVEILRRFNDSIDYWLSEPDRGIYDAMNKGIALATGEYVLHLNAGDRLQHIPSEELRNSLERQVEVACFAVISPGWGEFRPRTGLLMRMDNMWNHQGVFYLRRTHPGYDLRYPVLSDFDCNQKMVKAGRRVVLSRTVVAWQESIGMSRSARLGRERYDIVRENFGPFWVVAAVIWTYTAWLRLILKRILTFLESL